MEQTPERFCQLCHEVAGVVLHGFARGVQFEINALQNELFVRCMERARDGYNLPSRLSLTYQARRIVFRWLKWKRRHVSLDVLPKDIVFHQPHAQIDAREAFDTLMERLSATERAVVATMVRHNGNLRAAAYELHVCPKSLRDFIACLRWQYAELAADAASPCHRMHMPY
jgi:hypothetical protein